MKINENEIVNAQQRQVSFANSLTFFLLSFVVVYLINLFATHLASHFFGIDSVIKYYKVDYKINNESEQWTVDSLILIFYMAPFVSFLLAGVFSRLKNLFRADKGHAKLFLVWAFFHSINFCFASFIGGVTTEQGIWFALAWMGVPTIVMMAFAVVFAGVLYFIGSTSSLYFLECSTFTHPNNPINRQYWLLNAGLKTYFVGFLLIILLFLPEVRYYEIVIFISMIFMLIPLFRTSKLMTEIMIVEEIEHPKVAWKWMIIAVASLVLIRVVFA